MSQEIEQATWDRHEARKLAIKHAIAALEALYNKDHVGSHAARDSYSSTLGLLLSRIEKMTSASGELYSNVEIIIPSKKK